MISQDAYAKAVPPLGAEHHQKTIQGFVKEFVYLLPRDTSVINTSIERNLNRQSVFLLPRI